MIDVMTKPTEPQFLREPGDLVTRCICPFDGTWMHVTAMGLWECGADLHQWHRFGHSGGQPGGWKLMKTFKPKQALTIARALRQ